MRRMRAPDLPPSKDALRVAPGGSAPPIPYAPRRGCGAARSGRESRLVDRTRKLSWGPVRRAVRYPHHLSADGISSLGRNERSRAKLSIQLAPSNNQEPLGGISKVTCWVAERSHQQQGEPLAPAPIIAFGDRNPAGKALADHRPFCRRDFVFRGIRRPAQPHMPTVVTEYQPSTFSGGASILLRR
jgi:hypothetical protein